MNYLFMNEKAKNILKYNNINKLFDLKLKYRAVIPSTSKPNK